MTPVLFLPEAEAEYQEAQAWYASREPEVGERFADAVEGLVTRIGAHPEHFPIVHAPVRRALVRRFPYALFFRVEDDGIYVVACFHTSRAPSSWRRRV